MEKYVITIARQYGSGGRTIGEMLADKLGIHFYDKELMKLNISSYTHPTNVLFPVLKLERLRLVDKQCCR